MSKLEYVGPRVEISHKGIVYKKAKEDKYIYLPATLDILKIIDNDYVKKSFYSYQCENKNLDEGELHSILKYHECDIEEHVRKECDKYENKIENKITYIQNLPHLTDIDKKVWIKNIELLKEYKVKRAMNKIYYMHCIHNIAHLIRHNKIKEISTPFNKNFFHVLNTIKGTLITGKPSLEAKVLGEINKESQMIVRLSIK